MSHKKGKERKKLETKERQNRYLIEGERVLLRRDDTYLRVVEESSRERGQNKRQRKVLYSGCGSVDDDVF